MVKGRRQVTVELRQGEKLIAIDTMEYYRLGYPLKDIVIGELIDNAVPVVWCSVEQKWIE